MKEGATIVDAMYTSTKENLQVGVAAMPKIEMTQTRALVKRQISRMIRAPFRKARFI